MDGAKAARALAALRKTKGPEPVRRWKCEACGDEFGSNEIRKHRCAEVRRYGVLCIWCGDAMTRSQTRTHRCEEGK